MIKLNKNQKKKLEKYNFKKIYELKQAINIIKEITYTKFDASIDIDIKLGINTKKINIKGNVLLPYGIKKKKKILVFVLRRRKKKQKMQELTTLV